MLNQSRKRILTNMLWHFVPSVVRVLVSFLGTMLVAKVMNKSDFGKFQYLTSLFYVCLMYEQLTNGNIVKQYILEKDKSVLYSSILVSFCVSLFTIAITSFVFFRADFFNLWILLSIGLLFRSLSPLVYYFDAHLLSKYTGTTQLAGNIFYNLTRLLSPGSLIFQVIIFSMQFVLISILNSVVFFTKVKGNIFNFNKDLAISIVKNSLPIFVTVILMQLIQRVDVFLLEYFRGYEEVANYSIVMKFSEPWLFLASAIVVSIFPKLINIDTKNEGKLLNVFNLINKIMFLLSIVIITGTVMFSDWFITLIFDNKYKDSIELLNLYIFAIPFLYLNMVQQIWEQKTNKLYYSIYRFIISLVVNVSLNIYLIPSEGALGAVIATIVSYSVLAFWFNLFVKNNRRYFISQISIKPFNVYKSYFR